MNKVKITGKKVSLISSLVLLTSITPFSMRYATRIVAAKADPLVNMNMVDESKLESISCS